MGSALRKRPLVVALVLLAIVGAAMAAVAPWWTIGTPAAQGVDVQVPAGSSLASAASRLEEAGVVASGQHFLLLARLLGGSEPIKAGEYRFFPGEGWGRVLRRMQGGGALQYRLTVPEGMPSILVFERLMAEDTLTGEIAVPEEGSVLPDTYAFERGEPRAKVLARMQAAMDRTLAELWADRKPTAAVATPAEAIILASVVEKETGKPSERRMVAGVYSNRLRIGMKLDADPTVIYPVTKGKPLGRRIRRSELRADNGYNTYARPGLPQGPIANPGRESIAAVLDPAPTPALFFVADGTGGHVFANSLAEHNANVVKWRAIRRARGEL